MNDDKSFWIAVTAFAILMLSCGYLAGSSNEVGGDGTEIAAFYKKIIKFCADLKITSLTKSIDDPLDICDTIGVRLNAPSIIN